MKFQSHGFEYEIDAQGAINQLNPQPFVYDAQYCATYDTPEYQRQSELLQALRLGFVIGSHGLRPFRLLDYGYGNGAFMKFAKQHIEYVKGFDVTGLPIEGCEIVSNPYEFVDVITFWDALEHVQDLSFLRNLSCSTIVVSLPYCHLRTQGQEWFDTVYKHRKPNEHIHHFDRLSLMKTMSGHGWKMVSESTHEDIVRKSTHGLANILSMSFQQI